MKIKILIVFLVITSLFFVGKPEEFYRIFDLVASNKDTFKPFDVDNLVFDSSNSLEKSFQVTRSGYYEVGLLFENPTIKGSSLDSQFQGDVKIDIFAKDGELIFSETINKIKVRYLARINNSLLVREMVLSIFPLNTIRYGKDYKIKITSENKHVHQTKGKLYFAVTGYY